MIILTVKEIHNLYKTTIKNDSRDHVTYLVQKEAGGYINATKYTPLSGFLKEDSVDITDYFK